MAFLLNRTNTRSIATALVAALTFASAIAAEPDIALAIKNHRFEPSEIKVPANQRIRLTVHNQDSSPEEFESHALNREKVIPGKSTGTVYVGPLAAGSYPFVGEFNEKTAKGVIVAK